MAVSSRHQNPMAGLTPGLQQEHDLLRMVTGRAHLPSRSSDIFQGLFYSLELRANHWKAKFLLVFSKMMPRCPHCEASVRLSDINIHPQTEDQFRDGKDNYFCRNGHEFEAVIPLTVKNGYGIRADM